MRIDLGFLVDSIGRFAISVGILCIDGAGIFGGLAGIFIFFMSFSYGFTKKFLQSSYTSCTATEIVIKSVFLQILKGSKMSVKSAVQQFRDALEASKANLEDSKQKVVFFGKQVEKYTKALASLSEVLTPEDLEGSTEAPKAVKKPSEASGKAQLPKTDKDFWFSLVTTAPQKMNDILSTAVQKLGIAEDDKEAIAALRSRQAIYLQKFLDDGKLKSEGERRERTYFIA